jgi:membrane protease YdiL (CAAX protease family)
MRASRLIRPDPQAPAWAGPLVVYGAIGALSAAVLVVQGRNPLDSEPWLGLPALVRHAIGIAGGAALAAATIVSTRQLVRRFRWARALHAHLRPAVRHAGSGTLVVVGVASAISEELFFRGVLLTTFGLVASSIAFGLLHQVRGRARWAWAAWATVMGLLFGGLMIATGTLLGPMLAHAAINVANLRFLRDTDVGPPKRRRLGGLLGDG